MRTWIVALAALLVGCTAPGDEAICPVWLEHVGAVEEPTVTLARLEAEVPWLVDALPAQGTLEADCDDAVALFNLAEAVGGDMCADLYFEAERPYRVSAC